MLIAVSAAVGSAIVALIVVLGSWLLRKLLHFSKQQKGEDPLVAMFRQNREAYEERQREAVAALDERDPLREWAKRRGYLGWIGYHDDSWMVLFNQTTEGISEPVRGIRFDWDREPNLRKLPPIEVPFGVEMFNGKCTDRMLQSLSAHRNLVTLHVGCNDSVTDASLRFIRQMDDLKMLNLSTTHVSGKGIARLS
jgi:hypothetical protein